MNENERIVQLEVGHAKMTTLLDQNTKDIQDLKSDNKAIHDIATSVQVMATEMKGMSQQMAEMNDDISDVKKQVNDDISDVKNRVVNVENRPAKETSETVQKVKLAVYTAIATFLVTGVLGSLIMFVMSAK